MYFKSRIFEKKLWCLTSGLISNNNISKNKQRLSPMFSEQTDECTLTCVFIIAKY